MPTDRNGRRRPGPRPASPSPPSSSTIPIETIQAAFTELVHHERLHDIVTGHLHRRLRVHGDVEDRVAEGMAAAWRAFRNKALREGVLLEGRHLVFVATRHGRDTRLRITGGQERRCQLGADVLGFDQEDGVDVLDRIPAEALDPDDVIHANQVAERALSYTTLKEQHLLFLYLDDLNLNEMAEILGVSRGGALRRLQRTTERIRRRLTRSGICSW